MQVDLPPQTSQAVLALYMDRGIQNNSQIYARAGWRKDDRQKELYCTVPLASQRRGSTTYSPYSLFFLLRTVDNMILMLDGNSEIGAHVRGNLCYFICSKPFSPLFYQVRFYSYDKLNRSHGFQQMVTQKQVRT